jgi:hypothetical protein
MTEENLMVPYILPPQHGPAPMALVCREPNGSMFLVSSVSFLFYCSSSVIIPFFFFSLGNADLLLSASELKLPSSTECSLACCHQ